MADLDAAQSAALVQRQSADDLKSLILAFQRDGSVSGDFADPLDEIEDGDEKAAAAEARDTEIANSVLFAEVPNAAPSDEELAGNVEASVAAGESEEAAAPKASSKKAEAAAQGS